MNDKELLYSLVDMVRLHTVHVDREMSMLGLRNGQGGVISALGHNGSMSQNELANIRQVTPATISVMLGRMEKAGFITREVSSSGRSNVVSLTEKGQEIYKKVDAHMDREPSKILKGLTDEEKDAAAVIFAKISENLKNS